MWEIPQRIDTFESHELEWVPQPIKVLFREILSWEQDLIGVYRSALPVVRTWLEKTQATAILDLCSGAGGPALTLLKALQGGGLRDVKIKLTDLYPASEVYAKLVSENAGLSFEAESYNAMQSTKEETFRVRTLLSAFHHFSPEAAQKILIDAAQQSDGILIMDPFSRDLWHLLSIPVGTTLGTRIYPLLKDNSLFTWAVTYLVPILPAMYVWDSMASVLRGYTPDELIALTQTPECAAFEWYTGTWDYLPLAGLKGVYLAGYRK